WPSGAGRCRHYLPGISWSWRSGLRDLWPRSNFGFLTCWSGNRHSDGRRWLPSDCACLYRRQM
ncbi:uncharacterized protein METZ01_LOCUS200502, partial [marine metagenome]